MGTGKLPQRTHDVFAVSDKLVQNAHRVNRAYVSPILEELFPLGVHGIDLHIPESRAGEDHPNAGGVQLAGDDDQARLGRNARQRLDREGMVARDDRVGVDLDYGGGNIANRERVAKSFGVARKNQPRREAFFVQLRTGDRAIGIAAKDDNRVCGRELILRGGFPQRSRDLFAHRRVAQQREDRKNRPRTRHKQATRQLPQFRHK